MVTRLAPDAMSDLDRYKYMAVNGKQFLYLGCVVSTGTKPA